MRRMVVVGLVGSVVVAGVVITARRRAAPVVATGVPDWAPLRLVEPAAERSRYEHRDPVPAEIPRTDAPPPDAPMPLTPAADAEDATDSPVAKQSWVQPGADGNCPDSHPVKGKRASRIYHLPGGRYYLTTNAERCYCDAEAAEADGYRPAKR